ncbi:Rieske 2Fe-2S domain-containing protein [Methylobacterium sp. WL69]|uniref:FAD-dependent oxidoreductase n=1 Tax=Methylobacterium sp. WL69 TaxID=2603893 RepID=UPI0011CBBA68|nr:FAD-dependent oxidoreductase [Methylobacterium sp. WL69]TXM70271.1 Rieske 2Fe-2S domain-containing protein [Methylobacterium sp. WL69]
MPGTEIRLALDAIPMEGMKEGAAGDETVLFVRDASGVRAFQAKCPHLGAPLAKGEICGGRLYCHWHKAAFALTDGSLEEPPALDALTRYPVRIEGADAVAILTPEPAPTRSAGATVASVLVVGSGAAAVARIKTLRREGYRGRITMVGREAHPPYDRTKLSKQFLAKPTPPERVLIEPDFAQVNAVERITGEVVRVDPVRRDITLADGRTMTADAILVATGSRAVAPELPGQDVPVTELGGVFTLRNQGDKRLDYGGHTKGFDRVVLQSDPAALDFIAYYATGNWVTAACSNGRKKAFTAFLHLLGLGRLPAAAEIEAGADLPALACEAA